MVYSFKIRTETEKVILKLHEGPRWASKKDTSDSVQSLQGPRGWTMGSRKSTHYSTAPRKDEEPFLSHLYLFAWHGLLIPET